MFQGVPDCSSTCRTASQRLPGTIAGVRSGDTTLLTVNTVGIDATRQVLGREMPASWPAAALRVQAIAARTYAAFERAGRPASASYDLCDTTQCQVYGGRRLYSGGTVTDLQPASVLLAVAQTPRQVRTYAGAPIFAQFSASNGGWTVADPRFAYLPAKADPYDLTSNPYATWTASLSVARLAECFPAAGTVQRITVLSQDGHGDWGGRLLSVRLTGRTATGGAVTQDVSGSSLRSCAGMMTTYATVTSGLRVTVTPAAILNPDGSIDLFARGPAGDLQHRRYVPGAGWQAWQSHGGQIVGAPTVERDADGSLVVWARDGANQLVGGVWKAATWQGWTSYGGSITSRPSPAVLPDGSRYVVARGSNARSAVRELEHGRHVHRLRQPRRRARPGRPVGGRDRPGRVGGGRRRRARADLRQVDDQRGLVRGVHRDRQATTSDVAVAAPATGVIDVYLRSSDGTQALHTRRAVSLVSGAWQNAGGGLAAGSLGRRGRGRRAHRDLDRRHERLDLTCASGTTAWGALGAPARLTQPGCAAPAVSPSRRPCAGRIRRGPDQLGIS